MGQLGAINGGSGNISGHASTEPYGVLTAIKKVY
jgi:hypothetical protein